MLLRLRLGLRLRLRLRLSLRQRKLQCSGSCGIAEAKIVFLVDRRQKRETFAFDPSC